MKQPPYFDPFDAVTLADPYPLFDELRKTTPVFWHDGMRSWCLTRYADCVNVLRDPVTFARDRRRAGHEVPHANLSVQSLDPPDQAPVRGVFMKALHAQDMVAIENRAYTTAAELLTELSSRPSFDVMREVAAPLAVTTISDLLGVDPPEIPSFADIADAIMRSMDAGLDPSAAEPGRLAREQLSLLVDSWFNETHPRGLLGEVHQHARTWTGDEAVYVRNTARVMFQGGYSTMTAAIGNVIHTLMKHPAASRFLGQGAALGTVVDELVRFDGPVQGTSRIAMTACVIGDAAVQAGQTVVTLFAAANRDPAQFPSPGSLNLSRSPNPHLGYGWGTHSCIGTIPAQAVLRALVRALADHAATLRLAGIAVRRRTATMRVFATLPATVQLSP